MLFARQHAIDVAFCYITGLHQRRSDLEIAGVTGLSPESIRKTLSRARANLRLAVYGKEADTE